MARVGVLALQGGYQPHLGVLRNLGHEPVEVRSRDELKRVEGLILPGGESTSQLRLIERQNLGQPLNDFVHSGRPVLATCAGLILAARRVVHPEQPSLRWLDVTVERNAWGRQLDSFEATADLSTLSNARCALPLVFIRAPRIQEVGPSVQVLATYREEPILVRQRNVWGATFHPELSGDPCVHQAIFGGNTPHPRGPTLRERTDKRTLERWLQTLPGVRGFLRWSPATS
jgi:pyridoxal 5'-phosphate synthase pdxT subunit